MKNTIAGARRRPGYTLLEIMAVVVILTILAVKAAPRMAALLDKSRAAECLANRTILERAEERYRLDHIDQPSASLDTLYQARYIDRVPKCSSRGQYIWISTTAPVNMGCTVHDWPYAADPLALYSSDFNDMTGLKALLGGWDTAAGKLSNTTTGSEARIAFGSADWTDYSLTTTATLSSGQGFGIYYRANGNANISGYCFQYDPGWGNSFNVRKVINGVEQSQPFQTVSMPAGFQTYSTPHQITISVVGAVQKIYMDNQLIMSFSDSTFATGGGGFRTWNAGKASFDSVQVTQL